MKNLQTLEVKYYGATDTKGDRARIKDTRFNQVIWINRDYKDSFYNQVKDFLIEIGYKIIGYSSIREKDLFLTDNFQPIHEMKKNAENK